MERRAADRLTAEEETVLIETVQSDSPRAGVAFVALTNSLSGLARSTARKEGAKWFADENTLQSLETQGLIGISEAIRDFDLARGFRLSTYAYYKIRRRITEFLRLQARPRLKTVSLDEPVGHADSDDGEQMTYRDIIVDDSPVHAVRERADIAMLIPSLPGHLQSLTPRQCEVVHHRFWEHQTPAEISRSLGITRVRVGQILKESLERLRVVMFANDDLGLN